MTILLGVAASAAEQDPLHQRWRKLPRAAQALLLRMESCHHWAGEEPYDQARATEIERAMKKDACDRLAQDEARLLRRFPRHAALRDALREAHKRFQ